MVVISENETFQRLCRNVVRGTAPISVLESFGLEVIDTEAGFRMEGLTADVEFRPSFEDLCTGIFHHANQPRRVAQRWGFVMECILVLDHLEEFEDDPTIDALHVVLWDFSFGNPLDERTIEYARQVAELLSN